MSDTYSILIHWEGGLKGQFSQNIKGKSPLGEKDDHHLIAIQEVRIGTKDNRGQLSERVLGGRSDGR